MKKCKKTEQRQTVTVNNCSNIPEKEIGWKRMDRFLLFSLVLGNRQIVDDMIMTL